MLWEAAERVVSSLLLYPEARSAIGRAARAQRFGGGREIRARAHVERLWRDVDRIAVTGELARWAGELAERHALRAYDALHLASARAVADGGLVLVAADRDLISVAQTLGMATAQLP